MICKCSKKMAQVGGTFNNSPTQNFMCQCGMHNLNGRWFTKDEWEKWIDKDFVSLKKGYVQNV